MRIISALRVEQWVKNCLIFMPYILVGTYSQDILLQLIQIFFGFSLIVSSTYIVNDLKDIESDKNHPEKKYRAIASGYLNQKYWLFISFTLFLMGFLIIFITNSEILMVTGLYVTLTISYSFKFKYIKFVDLFIISILFVIRILVGGITSNLNISFYLTLFIFLKSLEIVSSKKLSILLNSNIGVSKVKLFLTNNYSKKGLLNLIYFASFSSQATYLLWIYYVKIPEIENLQTLYLLIAFLFLAFFEYYFIKETNKGLTEDILKLMTSKISLTLLISLFAIFTLLGIA